MNFEYLSELIAQMQYDEIKLIGKTVEAGGKPCHFISLVRQGEKVELCMLMQTKPWNEHVAKLAWRNTTRKLLKENHTDVSASLQAIHIGGQDFEVASGSGTGLDSSYNYEQLIFFAKMIEAGWNIPEDSLFYKEDWNRLMLMKYSLKDPMQQIPEFGDSVLAATMGIYFKTFFVEQRVKLPVASSQEGSECDKIMEFTVVEEDGQRRAGTCYINRVYLIDVWEEEEKRFADPQYQERMLEHMSQEELDTVKQQMFTTLEQHCPRGMYYIGLEYECTPDMSLEFYSSEYLKREQEEPTIVTGDSSVSVTLMHSRLEPDEELGAHGLKLRGAIIEDPVPQDTKVLWAELFTAHERVPEQRVILE